MKTRDNRLVELLREIDAERSITLARARELYGSMSEATWKRVKKRLEASGCKLEWDRQARRFRVADPLWTLERVGGPAQLRDRLTMLRANAAALGSPYVDQLALLFQKWDSQLDGSAGNGTPPPVQRPQPRADAPFYKNLATIEFALRDKRMISFAYTKTAGGKAKPREVEPYALHEHVGRFYVWGRERVKQAPKFFAVDLMRDVTLEDRFEPDPSFDLAESLRHSFGMFVGQRTKPMRVVVEIDPQRAAYVRARRWPAETSCDQLPSGALRIAFLVNDPQEVIFWVLSFGGAARVVEPAVAADLARRAAEDIAERHAWSKHAPKGDDLMAFEWPKEP